MMKFFNIFRSNDSGISLSIPFWYNQENSFIKKSFIFKSLTAQNYCDYYNFNGDK